MRIQISEGVIWAVMALIAFFLFKEYLFFGLFLGIGLGRAGNNILEWGEKSTGKEVLCKICGESYSDGRCIHGPPKRKEG